jgi:hypothetical protein
MDDTLPLPPLDGTNGDSPALTLLPPTLSAGLLGTVDPFWRAANARARGQIHRYDNPPLTRQLALTAVKPLVVADWGTAPGQNFVSVHLKRANTTDDLNTISIAGPGHGGPLLVANTDLEGSYSERNPAVSQDKAGMKRLFTQFPFPGGISSQVAPTTPGSIHEGGELGHDLSHAFAAAFDHRRTNSNLHVPGAEQGLSPAAHPKGRARGDAARPHHDPARVSGPVPAARRRGSRSDDLGRPARATRTHDHAARSTVTTPEPGPSTTSIRGSGGGRP